MQQVVVQRHLPGLAQTQLAACIVVAVVDLHRAFAFAIRGKQFHQLLDAGVAVAAQRQLLRKMGTRRREIEQLFAADAHVAGILVQLRGAAHHQQFILAYPRTVGLVDFVEHGQLDLSAAVVERDDRHASAPGLLDAQPGHDAGQHHRHAAPRSVPRTA